MTNSKHSCKRSLLFLHLPLPSRSPRHILWLIPLQRNLKHRSSSPTPNYNNRLRRICAPMRTDILLRSHRNYQPSFRLPLHRGHPSTMNLRWFLSRQRHPNPILRLPLPSAIRNCRRKHNPPPIPSSNRIKQPNRIKLRRRQSTISPIFFIQRPTRIHPDTNRTHRHCTLFPKPLRRPRQLHTRQPPRHTPTHQARMILPLCLRHPPIHPQQTRWGTGPTFLHPSTNTSTNPPHLQTTRKHIPTTLPNPLLNPSS